MLNLVIIDDEYFFRNSLKHALDWEEHGFRIIGDANNGKSGLELIIEKQPDIAIIDINMPVLNGLQLIEKLAEQELFCKYVLLTGYNEFKYAQKAIRLGVSEYILKPVDISLLLESLNTLKEDILTEREKKLHMKTLEKQYNIHIKENFFLDLINGYLSFNKTHLASYLKELNIQIPFENYMVFVLDFSKVSSDRLAKLRSFLQESISKYSIAEVFLTGHSQICVIEESDSSLTSHKQGTHIRTYLSSAELDYHIGISTIYHSVEEIIIAYNEARLCLKNALSRGTPVLSSNQISTAFYHISEEKMISLKKEIRLRNLSGVEKHLNALYKEFRKNELSHDNIVFCTYELLSCLFSVLNEQASINYLPEQSSQNIFDTINSLRSFDELQLWLTSLFRNRLSGSPTANEEEASVSGRIEQYIREHYKEPELSIDIIATKLFLNYSYICYCFKRDRGITINDYVNQIRLEKALELFHSGLDNVSYVSEQTGFNNSGYFSKKFKKAFGLSPSEYIKTL